MRTRLWCERNKQSVVSSAIGAVAVMALAACGGKPQAGGPAGPGGFAMPVKMQTVANAQAQEATEYVATIKSRRSATVQPQVEGVISRIFVKAGDQVKAGTPLLQIDPLKQEATVR